MRQHPTSPFVSFGAWRSITTVACLAALSGCTESAEGARGIVDGGVDSPWDVPRDGSVLDVAVAVDTGPRRDTGDVGAVACRPGERRVRLVNECGIDIWAAWAGNEATPGCQTDAECPRGTNCDPATKKCTVRGACSAAKDCPGVNQFCNGGTPSYTTNCNSSADCKSFETCNMSQTGYYALADGGAQPANTCATGPATDAGAGNEPEDATCLGLLNSGVLASGDKRHAFCDRTAAGQNRCAFHQCGSNKCYFAPVPVGPIPSDSVPCRQPSDCQDKGQFCYVPDGHPIDRDAAASPDQGYCVPVPVSGANSRMLPAKATGSPASDHSFCVPTPWGGRFWPRTGCKAGADGALDCDTGSCTGQKPGSFADSCALTGTNSPTLAELYFPPFGAIDPNDYYDVSLVDGVTVPVQIAPENYDMTVPAAVSNTRCDPLGADICPASVGVMWACDKSGFCVNKLQCSSPGCVSGCDQFGHGSLLGTPCTWKGPLALTEAECPPELHNRVGADPGTYVGCLSPKDACAAKPTAAFCADKELFECSGPTASVSCYTASAPSTCCGCPTWVPDGGTDGCQNRNPTWKAKAEDPYYSKFHAACPTAYTFPFDDKSSLFTCSGQSRASNVHYTITFCPK